MKKKKIKFNYWLALLILILIGVISWTFYSVINQGAGDILKYFGVSNFYIQNLIIIVVIFILLFIAGYGFKKTFERMIK